MSSPKVSIIVPVYNVEKYFSRCLDSILNQTFQDFEILIVNDLTPDNSIKIAETFAEQDKRIRILHNDENSGAGWSRMVGYTNAKGEYITFCDPDDYLPKNALEVLYTAMIETPDADICIGDYQRVYPDGSKSDVFENKLVYGNDKLSVAKSTLTRHTPHFLWNKIYKKELFKNTEIIAYKNFSNSSDEFLFFQVLQHCNKAINVNEVVYYYYDNQQSVSYNKSNVEAISAMITSVNYITDIYKDKKEFKDLIHKWKTSKFSTFLLISKNDRKLTSIIIRENIKNIFTPWNLLSTFHKRKALKLYYIYLRARFRF